MPAPSAGAARREEISSCWGVLHATMLRLGDLVVLVGDLNAEPAGAGARRTKPALHRALGDGLLQGMMKDLNLKWLGSQRPTNSGKNLPLFSIPYTTLNGGATEAPIHWLRTHAHTNTHDTHANANTHTWRATRHILIVSTPRGTHRCSPSSALARANLMCALRRHSLSMSVSNFFNIGLSLSVSFLTSSYSVQLFSFVCSFSAIARSDCDWPSISFTRLNI